jgi:hypothetical protein
VGTTIEKLTELLRKEAWRTRRWLGALRDTVNDMASVMLAGFLATGHAWAAAGAPGRLSQHKRS